MTAGRVWSSSVEFERDFSLCHSLTYSYHEKILEHSNTGTGNVRYDISQNQLTFDYLIFSCSDIAAAGLLQDSPVTVVASMLVSPLMYVYPPKIFFKTHTKHAPISGDPF